MGLNNLVGKSLEKIDPDAIFIKRLLASAVRNIADAQVALVALVPMVPHGNAYVRYRVLDRIDYH